ncbi:DUF2797 domain-containing protein [Amphritea japonica]|uniref:DUF2797 domain-containing protein n=1 Tax=Amphritea japonica ATCC BAA-1530 TaxID=1278309 RepID=A0A7R6P3I1_9GAMM|nr:DUF2797 domain-containing protein [Amphritea japonica]BBB26523.1 conserved hypothetical protein [Amphritea japonica ATCC BAA-1530]
MQLIAQGPLQKMPAELATEVKYRLQLGDQSVDLNSYVGQSIRLAYQGQIHCTHCGRKTNKSFAQGYCYPCFKKLPQCDLCIMSPEKCHFDQGTCRDPDWGEQFCFQSHYVYLANSSGIKVGITRGTQVPTRWIDQGAIQALPILRVETRFQSGVVERVFGEHITDRTNWRAMLKGQVDPLDLVAERERLFELCRSELTELENRFGLQALQRLPDAEVLELNYPVLNYPAKISSLNFDKTPVVEGVLQGIKGQYLILDTGVINLRKFTAYEVQFSG